MKIIDSTKEWNPEQQKKLNKAVKIYMIILIGIFFLISLVIILNAKFSDNLMDKTYRSRVVGRVEKVSMYKGFTYVDLDNNSRYLFSPCVYNGSKLYNFLQKGDSIRKKENSDVLYVFRNENKYKFVPPY